MTLLSVPPDPLKIASRPVDCIAATIAEGAANEDQYQVLCCRSGEENRPVPSMLTSWSLRFASTFWIPLSLYNEPEMSLTQLSQVIGTANRVYMESVPDTRDAADGGIQED